MRLSINDVLFSSGSLLSACFLSVVMAGGAHGQVQFSEFLLDSPGSDQGREFIEISGTPGQSLDGYTLIEIEGDGTGSGTIDGVLDLTGLSLGTNGLLLIRDAVSTVIGSSAVPAVLNPAPEPETTIVFDVTDVPGDYNDDKTVNTADYTLWRDAFAGVEGVTIENDLTPTTVDIDDYELWKQNFGVTSGSFFAASGDGVENGSITLALVQGFTGATGNDVDTDNDGVLDTTPWTSVSDAVGFDENGPDLLVGTETSPSIAYGAALGGIDFDGELLSENISFFGDDPNGFVRLDDGNGGTIDAVFNADSFTASEPSFGYGINVLVPIVGGPAVEVTLDLSSLGPFGISNIFANDGTEIGFATFDSNGDLFLIDPDLELLTDQIVDVSALVAAIEAGGATVDTSTPITFEYEVAAGATISVADGDPAEIFFLTPGSANGSGALGQQLTGLPAASAAPEPASACLLAIGALLSLRRRR